MNGPDVNKIIAALYEQAAEQRGQVIESITITRLEDGKQYRIT